MNADNPFLEDACGSVGLDGNTMRIAALDGLVFCVIHFFAYVFCVLPKLFKVSNCQVRLIEVGL